MSLTYPGGFITKNPTAPTASSSPGMWTIDQALQNKKAGNWPPNGPFYYVEDVFSTYLYTGNGTGSSTTNTITNEIDLSNNGGLVWIKRRDGAYDHTLFDTARGVKKELYSNSANAETTRSTTSLTAFNTNGFTLTGDSDPWNTNGQTYVAWTFRKAAKFFDVVTWTGDGVSGRTISHSLGSTPGCIIFKQASGSGGSWDTYHRSLWTSTNGPYVRLNETTTSFAASQRILGVSSANFTIGDNSAINASGETYVAYLFAHDAGGFGTTTDQSVVKCGSYTGNGSATGPEIDLGFEAQWVLVKGSDVSGAHWYLTDINRGMAFQGSAEIYPNLSAGEQAQTKNIIPTPRGFQIVTTDGYLNTNTKTYIYVAIRRGPMKTPTDATKVFEPVLGVSSSSAPYMTASTSFNVDGHLMKSKASTTEHWYMASRLMGTGVILRPSTTAGEVTGDYPAWARQTGVGSNVGNSDFSGYITYNFRRAPGFFDVVCYTGTGSNRTVNHNLGKAPELMIVKVRNQTGAAWAVYHSSLGNTQVIRSNTTAAATTSSAYWNNTSPTSSVFTIGNDGDVNNSGDTYIAYLFSTVAGVSKVGSYTGNESTNQIDCGFTNGARFILIRRTDTVGNWGVFDTVRGIISANDPALFLNSAGAENTANDFVDPYSAGFQLGSSTTFNASGGNYIYLAIA
jgi:hypothetical protein